MGGIHPVPGFLLTGLLGGICLSYLGKKLLFPVHRIPALRAGLELAAGAFVFGMIIIAIDLWLRFPENLNVAFPASLLFYPSIGFVAEIVFHLLPFTLLMISIEWIKGSEGNESVFGIALVLVALVEPLYHVVSMYHAGQVGMGILVITGMHILIFSLYQLSLFVKHGFFHMYLFRLIYYLIWHVGWGYVRLQLF
jgi:hypothetical protein